MDLMRPFSRLINVLDEGVFEDVAGEVAHPLMDVNDHASIRFGRDTQRLDVGINDAPLPGPILANAGMAENAAAFHGIRPHDIGVHDGQYRIDVARVEGVIRAAEKILSVHLGFILARHGSSNQLIRAARTGLDYSSR